MNKPQIEIFATGSSAPNPGTGGWAAVVVSPAHNNLTYELRGTEENISRKRIELTSVISALQWLQKPCRVCLTIDSEYIANAIKLDWLTKWKEKNWRSPSRKAIKNSDLWQRLDELMKVHEVEWKWGKDNNLERARKLSFEAREALRLEKNLRARREKD